MKRVWLGLLWIFVDVSLTFGSCKIGLLPDFIGYLLIAGEMAVLGRESAHFRRVRPVALGMTAYTGVLYLLDAVGVSAMAGTMLWVLSAAATLLSLYVTYAIVQGMTDMERVNSVSYRSGALRRSWVFLAVGKVLVYVGLLSQVLMVAAIVLTVIATVWFLAAAYQSTRLCGWTHGNKEGVR